MANRYKIRDNAGLYFVTFTIVGWVDLFVRRDYKDCLIDSLNYCVKEKVLRVHAYVLMTSHLHMIVSSAQGHDLVSTIRDFKKFTSKSLIRLIKAIPESRREWMLNKFSYEANRTQRGSDYILWKEGYHAKQIETNDFLDEKLDYIHNNPVEAGFVNVPEEYLYSSARNYAGKEAVMAIDLL
ncbi:MAG: transposase [Reichenbachiella sp.]|uniref:REP-associated tyrosine transposase n=1 Tax=Reichenbachiella sp. TaxID=2184521 RepID=UPI00296696D6|nr:transposase [Reichenbachiella sp.]MDW3209199.1 transposase [Reichenbachiella sp.]